MVALALGHAVVRFFEHEFVWILSFDDDALDASSFRNLVKRSVRKSCVDRADGHFEET